MGHGSSGESSRLLSTTLLCIFLGAVCHTSSTYDFILFVLFLYCWLFPLCRMYLNKQNRATPSITCDYSRTPPTYDRAPHLFLIRELSGKILSVTHGPVKAVRSQHATCFQAATDDAVTGSVYKQHSSKEGIDQFSAQIIDYNYLTTPMNAK